jgi:serine phosphatase RsbU (regulator of sigma subunit)
MFFGFMNAIAFCGMFYAMAYEQIWWILLIIFIFGGLWWLIVSGILVTVSASLSYDVWPDKYQTFEAIKRGKMINQRFGWCLTRAVLYAFILLGVLTFILRLIPGTSVMINEESKVDYGPYNGIFFITAGIFGVIISLHSQYLLTLSFIRKKTKRAVWLWAGGIVISLFLPFLLSVSMPITTRLLIGLAQGILLTYIFIKHDFLTLAFTALIGFVFINGWLFFISADLLQIMILGLFLIFILGVAVAGLFSKESGEDILDYVPEYVKEIENKQRMEREFEIARHIQTTMLCCKTPQTSFLDIASVCDPAYEVGGDYYDFVHFEKYPNRIGIVIGDVSGKGVSAAFYMTLAKGILQTQATITPDSTKETLCRVNDVFYDHIQRDKFISMIYAIFDFQKGTLLLSRAGHNPLVIKQSSASETETLMPNGIAIGLQKGKRFCESLDEVEIRFKGGDVYVFFTDGFSEAMNKKGEEYGDEQLYEVIRRHSTESPSLIIEAIRKDVQIFTGAIPQHDDMTMIVVKVK